MDSLQDLLYRRCELKAQINSLHDTFVQRQVPEEIVSSIFVSTVGHPTNHNDVWHQFRSPLTLGAVCRTWRRIAWSTPNLWTALEVGIGPDEGEKRAQLLLEWLGRSRNLPLSIRVYTLPDVGYAYLSPVIEIINRCSDRWYSLNLDVPDSFLSSFSDAKCDFSILHTLKFRTYTFSPTSPDIINAAPTKVAISGPPIRTLRFKWKNVTHASGDVLDTNEIVDLLERAPQLVDCSFSITDGGRMAIPWFPDRRQPVTHPQLKSLTIDLLRELTYLFGNISLPGLTKLTLISQVNMPVDVLISLLARSCYPLEELNIQSDCITGNDLVQLARAAPLLTKLSIRPNTTHVLNMPLDSFYQALSSHLPTEGDDEPAAAEPLLPLLQIFTLDAETTFPWELVLGLFAPLNETENAPRRPLKSVNITCESVNERDYADRQTLSFLQKLQEEISLRFLCYGNDLIEWSRRKVEEEGQQDVEPPSDDYWYA